MHCTNCGAQIPENANNCPQCGASASNIAGAPMDPRVGHVAGQPGAPTQTYLVPAILVTIFCCQIFGIVAIVYAAIAMGKNSAGQYQEAAQAAKSAKMWCWLGFGIGFIIVGAYMVLMMIGVFASAAGTTP